MSWALVTALANSNNRRGSWVSESRIPERLLIEQVTVCLWAWHHNSFCGFFLKWECHILSSASASVARLIYCRKIRGWPASAHLGAQRWPAGSMRLVVHTIPHTEPHYNSNGGSWRENWSCWSNVDFILLILCCALGYSFRDWPLAVGRVLNWRQPAWRLQTFLFTHW